MSYRPKPCNQGDGTALQWSNCTWASAVMAADRHSVGTYRFTPAKLRSLSGDTSGGSSYSQNSATVDHATGGKVKLEARYGITRSQMKDYAVAGRSGSVSIDTNETAGTARATGTFRGGHTVYFHGYYYKAASSTRCTCEKRTTAAHGEYDVKDPGRSSVGYQRWSADLLYRAAERRGGGTISVLLTRDTEGVTRTSAGSSHVRSTTDTAASSKGTTTNGAGYFVVSTSNGGTWQRPDGTLGDGWHKIKFGTGYGQLPGRALS